MPKCHDLPLIAAALATALLMSSCSGDDAKPEAKPEPFKKSVTHTHDGAMPLTVVNSYEQQWRAGNAEVTCALLSTVGKTAVVDRAAAGNLVAKKAPCEKAVDVLQDLTPTPARVELIDIPVALDDSAEIILHRDDKTAQVVTLSTDETGAWVIDSIEGYKVPKETEPEVDPDTETQSPVGTEAEPAVTG